ncbi:hypothetical protein [Flavobacterium sp. 3HN19-14]|uniref:hypothetical protein n=1 Tax=Flavobacterium sp. 3HN19-14 TaxID=3448133 RepID=UPI003EE28D64
MTSAANFYVPDTKAWQLLLKVLETTPDAFPDWQANYSTINADLLVSSTATFDKYYNIFESRQTFLALIPTIRQVEDQYINTFLCSELIEHLKSTSISEPSQKQVKVFLQKAVVAFTISKIYDEGLFLLDASGLRLKYDTLPYEQAKIPDYGKQADQISRAVAKQNDNGLSYLLNAKDIIKADLSKFDQCEIVFINEAKSEASFQPYNTKSTLGL